MKQKIKNKAEEMNEVPVVINHFKLKTTLKKGKITFERKMLFKVENYCDRMDPNQFVEYTVKILFKYDYLIEKLGTRSVFKFSDQKNYVHYKFFTSKSFKDYLNHIPYYEKKNVTKEVEDIWIKGKNYFMERKQNEKD